MRIAHVSPDIIGLTEIKPKNPRYVLQEAEIVINGYDCWPAISSSGRGVAIYTKNALQATAVNPLPDSSFKDAIWCGMLSKFLVNYWNANLYLVLEYPLFVQSWLQQITKFRCIESTCLCGGGEYIIAHRPFVCSMVAMSTIVAWSKCQ